MDELVVTHKGSRAALRMLAEGILMVALSGPICAASLVAVKRPILAMRLAGLRGFVVDYTRGVVTMDAAQLDAIVAEDQPGSAARFPVAIVARPEDSELFMGHALRMAQRGIMRRVFYDPLAATAWAQAMGARGLLPAGRQSLGA